MAQFQLESKSRSSNNTMTLEGNEKRTGQKWNQVFEAKPTIQQINMLPNEKSPPNLLDSILSKQTYKLQQVNQKSIKKPEAASAEPSVSRLDSVNRVLQQSSTNSSLLPLSSVYFQKNKMPVQTIKLDLNPTNELNSRSDIMSA